ncbi:MAG: DUF1294 domain-containing protein [Planctomycetaceae bacterium]|nr:DUF1294 domain-containing protein [Planctomycetaceae bacterium]
MPEESPRSPRRRRFLWNRTWGLFVLLLILPGIATYRLTSTLSPILILGYLAVISAWTFIAYGHDKRRAQVNGWRVREWNLHLLELFGGWPAAYVAQNVFRHKTAKIRFLAVFWTIVALHQLLAFDAMNNWRLLGMMAPGWGDSRVDT